MLRRGRGRAYVAVTNPFHVCSIPIEAFRVGAHAKIRRPWIRHPNLGKKVFQNIRRFRGGHYAFQQVTVASKASVGQTRLTTSLTSVEAVGDRTRNGRRILPRLLPLTRASIMCKPQTSESRPVPDAGLRSRPLVAVSQSLGCSLQHQPTASTELSSYGVQTVLNPRFTRLFHLRTRHPTFRCVSCSHIRTPDICVRVTPGRVGRMDRYLTPVARGPATVLD